MFYNNGLSDQMSTACNNIQLPGNNEVTQYGMVDIGVEKTTDDTNSCDIIYVSSQVYTSQWSA